jgi:hypothetical protein
MWKLILYLLISQVYASNCMQDIVSLLKENFHEPDTSVQEKIPNNFVFNPKMIRSEKTIYSLSDIHENLNYYISLLCHAGVSVEKKMLKIPGDIILTIHGDLLDSKNDELKSANSLDSLEGVLKLSTLLLDSNKDNVYFILGNHELFNFALYKLNPNSIEQLKPNEKNFIQQFMNISSNEILLKKISLLQKYWLPLFSTFITGLMVEHVHGKLPTGSRSFFLHSGLSKDISLDSNSTSHSNYTNFLNLKVPIDRLTTPSGVFKEFPHFINKQYDPQNFGIDENDFDLSGIHTIVTGHCSLIKDKIENPQEIKQIVKTLGSNENTTYFVMIDSGLQYLDFSLKKLMLHSAFFKTIPLEINN